jgi:hypothetical protein
MVTFKVRVALSIKSRAISKLKFELAHSTLKQTFFIPILSGKKSHDFVFSQHKSKFLDSEERVKIHENSQTPGEQFMESFGRKVSETALDPLHIPKILAKTLF